MKTTILFITLVFFVNVLYAQMLDVIGNGNLRSGPGKNFEIIGKVTIGMQVKQLEYSKDWYNIEMPDKKQGWLFKTLVKEHNKTIEKVSNNTKSNNPELKWNDGFLEGVYIDSSNFRGSTFDSLMRGCECLAISRRTLENGVIYKSMFCEKNGIFARNGIILPDGKVIIYEKFVKDANGMLYGFKFENEDKKAPYILHKLLKKKLTNYGNSWIN